MLHKNIVCICAYTHHILYLTECDCLPTVPTDEMCTVFYSRQTALFEHCIKIFIKISMISFQVFVQVSMTSSTWNVSEMEWVIQVCKVQQPHNAASFYKSKLPLFNVSAFFGLLPGIYRSSNLTIKNIVRRTMKLPWILEAPAKRQLNISYLKRKDLIIRYSKDKFKKSLGSDHDRKYGKLTYYIVIFTCYYMLSFIPFSALCCSSLPSYNNLDCF